MMARTKYRNTLETDMMDRVCHVVTQFKSEEKYEIEIYATDPMDAISKASKIPFAEWEKSCR
jgi:hypothetical protein